MLQNCSLNWKKVLNSNHKEDIKSKIVIELIKRRSGHYDFLIDLIFNTNNENETNFRCSFLKEYKIKISKTT